MSSSASASPQIRDQRSLRGWSTALLAWSLLYALVHLYWGLGGTAGLFTLRPAATETGIFEEANLLAFGLIGLTGLLGFALEWTAGTRLPRYALLFVVAAGAGVAASHGVYGIVFRALSVIGVTDVDGEPFDLHERAWVLWDMLAIEPWFLIEGVLLAVVGYVAQTSGQNQVRWLWAVAIAFFAALASGLLGVRAG